MADTTTTNKAINVANDFARHPAGRYRGDWPYSGEAFREKFLKPVLKSGGNATVVFDGAMGYGSSFLEEAFAGLIREGFSKREVQDAFQLVSEDDPSIIIEIEGYLTEPEIPGEISPSPKTTKPPPERGS